jgi:hypothetical protein
VAVAKGKVLARRLDTPFGDDRFKFKGQMVLAHPFTSALDPPTNGVRIIIEDAANAILLDATIPGGIPFDVQTQNGWSTNAKGNVFLYRNTGNVVPYITGIKKVVVRDLSTRTPGLVKFTVVGKDASLPVPALPLRATLVIDPPVAPTGQCGLATFPGLPGPVCVLPVPGFVVCK